ncbi:MAG: SxtJ family membrane protein [Verrucomicrobiota bacterium]
MKKNAQLHESFEREKDVRLSSDCSFGWVFTVAFLVIALLPLIHGRDIRLWATVTSAIFFIVTLMFPKALHPLNKLWQKFGLLLHAIIQPIVLGILFFLVFTPTALLARLLKKDFLHLGFDPKMESYWIQRKPAEMPASQSMKYQF